MKLARLATLATLTLAALSSAAFADSFKYDGLNYANDVRIVGFKDGFLNVILKGNEKQYDLNKVDLIEISDNPKFNAAEDSRADTKKAAALYADAIRASSRKDIKLLAQARAIKSLENDGKWLDAVTAFLDIYQAAPTEATASLRPTVLPAANSSMLKESADRIAARLNNPAFAKKTDAIKTLKTLQLEIYTKANDPKAAALAKELGVGTVESTGTSTATPNTPDTATPNIAVPSGGGANVAVAETALNEKKYDDAIRAADSALAVATGDVAIKLYTIKANAYLAQDKLEEAALNLLRIAIHYPNTPAAPTALLQAADIQKKLKLDDEAKRLYKEIAEKYPNSVAATAAKKHL